MPVACLHAVMDHCEVIIAIQLLGPIVTLIYYENNVLNHNSVLIAPHNSSIVSYTSSKNDERQQRSSVQQTRVGTRSNEITKRSILPKGLFCG